MNDNKRFEKKTNINVIQFILKNKIMTIKKYTNTKIFLT